MNKTQVFDNQIIDLGKENDELVPRVISDSNYWIHTIIGNKGSGKSNLLLNILEKKLLKLYDNIYFVSPTAEFDKKFENLVKELKESEGGSTYYNDFSEDICQDIRNRIIESLQITQEPVDEKLKLIKQANHIPEKNQTKSKKRGHVRSLFILDDCMSSLSKSTEKNSVFNRMITTSRHLKTDIIILVQCFKGLNTIVRKNSDIISIFPSINKNEQKVYYEELDVDEKVLDNLIERAKKRPFGHFTINHIRRFDPKYFVNFELIN